MVGVNRGSAPDHPATAVDFVAELKQLKERSGRTFRQLEERAAANGDLLPRSTIADVLRRPALPRADLVAAFVAACGGTPEDVAAWLAARERLATAEVTPPPAAPPRRRWLGRAPVVAAAIAAVTVVVATGIWLGVRDDGRPAVATSPSTATTAPAAWAVAGPVRIHPAGMLDLCLTEGVDRSGGYGSAVAAQRPCAEAEPPVTRVEPVRADLVHIKWDHPNFGVGCLTVLVAGPGRGLVEPQDECLPGNPTQLFRIERSAPDRHRIRSAHGDLCLGVRGEDRAVGAEVVPEPCTGAPDQEYLIEPRT